MIKEMVGWSIGISFFIAINIILFGGVPHAVFPFVYFVLISALFLGSIILSRRLFKKRSDVVFLVVIALIFSIFLSVFASAVDSYIDSSVSYKNNEVMVKQEIANTNSNIKYYTDYINFLNGQIKDYNTKSQQIQDRIAELGRQVQEPVYVQEDYVLDDTFYESDYWDNEGFWDDDAREEEDD